MSRTEQEIFWMGDFGDKYIGRNESANLLASNLHFFSKVFGRIEKPKSLIEFGANIGMNLKAMQLLFPQIDLFGIEINKKAADDLKSLVGNDKVFNGSIFDYKSGDKQYEVSLIKGVLIHINPDYLSLVYEKLYESSSKYILIAEYYNPSPVAVKYRGHDNRLFKRDFAGEIMDSYSDLSLIDYGFVYSRDIAFPQDDITWFLLKK